MILLINTILAADVGYVLKKERRAEQGFLDVFEDLGLSVDFVESKEIKDTDFSQFKYLIIGDNRLDSVDMIPQNIPTVIASHYYLKKFGLLNEGRCSKKASNGKLKVKKNGDVVSVYNRPKYKRGGVGIPYYYLPDKYKSSGLTSAAKTYIGKRNKKTGDVISYSSSGGVKKCFFGITKSKYWTDEAEDLFEDCVKYIAQGLHDVKIDETLSSSVNGIRIRDNLASSYITDDPAELECGKSYKVDYKTLNVGDYTENIGFRGEIGNVFSWTATKTGLAPGKSTTTGSKTFTANFAEGDYVLQITADSGYDDNPGNNVRVRDVEVVC